MYSLLRPAWLQVGYALGVTAAVTAALGLLLAELGRVCVPSLEVEGVVDGVTWILFGDIGSN